MIRRPPRSTQSRSSAASDVYKRQARWLTTALQQGLSGRIVLEDARGTVWNGSARLTLTGGAGSTDAATLPGRLAWLIRPTWSGLRADLNADCCMQQAWHLNLQPRWAGAKLA